MVAANPVKAWLRDPFTVTALAASTLLLLVAVAYPSFQSQPGDEMKPPNLSRANMLAKAIQLYATDFDDYLPYASTTSQCELLLDEYTKPSFKNASDVWHCDPPGGRFQYNTVCTGKRLEQIRFPAVAIGVIDDRAWGERGSREIGFLDGHAKTLDSVAVGGYLIRWDSDGCRTFRGLKGVK